jgi:hypothetical protein
MAKPAKNAYSLQEVASEWTKLWDDDVTVRDVLSYAADGRLTVSVGIIAEKKFEVLNPDDFVNKPGIIGPDNTTYIANVYLPIDSRRAALLLSGDGFSLEQIHSTDMVLRPMDGPLKIGLDDIYVLTADKLGFEEPTNNAQVPDNKLISTTERNTLLTIIAALCDHSAIKHQERGAAAKIKNLTEKIGAAVSDDTVRRILAKIPDALESRKK